MGLGLTRWRICRTATGQSRFLTKKFLRIRHLGNPDTFNISTRHQRTSVRRHRGRLEPAAWATFVARPTPTLISARTRVFSLPRPRSWNSASRPLTHLIIRSGLSRVGQQTAHSILVQPAAIPTSAVLPAHKEPEYSNSL